MHSNYLGRHVIAMNVPLPLPFPVAFIAEHDVTWYQISF